MVKSLKVGGLLVLMTDKLPETINIFRGWYYIRDPTHVGFLSDPSWKYITEKYNLEPVYQKKPVWIAMKKGDLVMEAQLELLKDHDLSIEVSKHSAAAEKSSSSDTS